MFVDIVNHKKIVNNWLITKIAEELPFNYVILVTKIFMWKDPSLESISKSNCFENSETSLVNGFKICSKNAGCRFQSPKLPSRKFPENSDFFYYEKMTCCINQINSFYVTGTLWIIWLTVLIWIFPGGYLMLFGIWKQTWL